MLNVSITLFNTIPNKKVTPPSPLFSKKVQNKALESNILLSSSGVRTALEQVFRLDN